MKQSVYIVLFMLLGLWGAFAQKTSKQNTAEEKSYVLVDLSYMNDAIFMGRSDSIAAPYLLPSIGYYDKSGLFADVTASYLTSSGNQRVDLFYVTGGYMFDTKNWSGGLSGTTYFYNQDSYNVQSEVVADITGLLSYDFKLLELSVYASTYFNKNSSPDLFLGFMVDKPIYAMKKQLLIDPKFSIFAGSQYFYQEYYTTSRLGNRKGQGKGQGGSSITEEVINVEIAEASEFNVLNLELGLPVHYQHKHFIFSFSPTWAFPQTPATLTTDDGVYKEDLKNVFYWSVGVSYWFKTKKN